MRSLREKKGIPIRKVADILDLDQSTLSKFERDKRLPKKEMLPKIADYFEVSLEEVRSVYLCDKVLRPILAEQDPEKILNIAQERLRYIKDKNYNQGKLNF